MQNNIINKQLNRMLDLMGPRTINESQKKAQDPVEYSTKGPDGNYYGIVREGAKYYIKTAKPNAKGNLIKEHLDYIGGFCERKANEYNSFASAKRGLEGKLYSLSEAIKANATLVECNTNKSKSKMIIIEAKGNVRADIKRQLEIMNNSQVLDEERAGYKSANALIKENEEKATPFTVEDKEGEPFNEKGMPTFNSTGEFKNKVYKGGETIIGQFNEAEEDEDVLGPDDDESVLGEEPIEDEAEMDLGDGFDDDDDVMASEEEVVEDDDDNEDADFEDGDVDDDSSLDDSEFEENTYTIYLDPSDLESGEELNIQVKVGESDETDEFEDDSLYGDVEEDDFDFGGDDEDVTGLEATGELEDASLAEEGEDDEDGLPMEAYRRRGRMLKEENYFGKHPKYLAKPFTTPRAHADFPNTYDWNDESVDNEEEPFTDNQRYKYFSERPKSIEKSLGLAESRYRSKKGLRRF